MEKYFQFFLFSWLNSCVFQFSDMYRFSGYASVVSISIEKNYEILGYQRLKKNYIVEYRRLTITAGPKKVKQ